MKKSSDKKYDIEVSARVQELLDEFNLTEKWLAEILNASTSSINYIMRGKSPWRLCHLVEVAKWFGKPLDYLVFGDTSYIAKFSAQRDSITKDQLRKHYINIGDLASLRKHESENLWDIAPHSKVAEPEVKYKKKK